MDNFLRVLLVILITIDIIMDIIIITNRKKHRKCKKCKTYPTGHKKNPWYATSLNFSNSIIIKGTIMNAQMKINQHLVLGWPVPKDAAGNETTVQPGSIKFAVVNEDGTSNELLQLEPVEGDQYAVKVISAGTIGAALVKISADADRGEGEEQVRTIEGYVTVSVLPGDAVGFGDPSVSEAQDN